ncbi:MAG: hypothetical protein COC01_07030 [Bacteroidetes bacterium]|nr:MAG: hypothetical protein COC01_07030 [Bacteroidota bacterium]
MIIQLKQLFLNKINYKSQLFGLFVCVALFACKTQKPIKSETEKIQSTTTEVKLIGILEEELYFPPPCEDVYHAIVYKYKVKQVIEGNYKNDYILIKQPCPELKGEDFFVSKREYLIDANTNKRDNIKWQTYNYYMSSELPKYWAISITKNTD